jgi:hypothetical protein
MVLARCDVEPELVAQQVLVEGFLEESAPSSTSWGTKGYGFSQ